jgi:hypothetical protein
VLRVWREQPEFITYNCERCDAQGYCHDGKSVRSDPVRLRRLIKHADERQVAHIRKRRELARWLWGEAHPIKGTIAERYLRSRGITCALPATLRFLPSREKHAPAMLAVFGVPAEPIPGVLDVARMAIYGVHVTRLKPDGSGKAPDDEGRSKIMIGSSAGWPIVLAPVNDLCGLAVAEGIEDALSLYQETQLGAWAAGSANRLPPLARVVPRYVTSATISVDADEAGRR